MTTNKDAIKILPLMKGAGSEWDTAIDIAMEALKAQSADGDRITDEQAIEHLQSTGRMQNHDREMYESGLREQLADDSGSYDALIPSEDTISRQAAIDALKGLPTWWADEGGYYGGAQPPMKALLDPEDSISALENLPSVQPNLYGYTIEHLALIARVMEAEGISPQEAIRKFENTKYICELLIDEIQKNLDEAMKSCFYE